jgi:hypothetical protein
LGEKQASGAANMIADVEFIPPKYNSSFWQVRARAQNPAHVNRLTAFSPVGDWIQFNSLKEMGDALRATLVWFDSIYHNQLRVNFETV